VKVFGKFKLSQFIATSLVFCAMSLEAHATIYNIASGTFDYTDSTSLTGTLETNLTGSFTTEAEIENFFNNSTFSLSFFNGSIELFNLNNSNALWDLEFSYENGPQTTSAQVIVDANAINIDFSTPTQPSSVVLFLKELDAEGYITGYIQFHQSNNISDGNFVGADYNAIHFADKGQPYNSNFVLPAVNQGAVSAVPVPPAIYLLISGLGLLGGLIRKS
jgi:hypothetical protein